MKIRNKNSRKPISFFLLAASLAISATAFQVISDVPYVRTPYFVVKEMLKLAGVGTDDIVFDLGCGDGRIVITAVKFFGAKRGVGVDIDQDRIGESLENARKSGVSNRLEFIRQDLFSLDIGEATVVALYLLPEVNLRLRPKLLRELQPGSRVVSHDFDMAEWEADRVLTLPGLEREHLLYSWIVPARIEGSWHGRLADNHGNPHLFLDLRQRFQKVNGKLRMGEEETELTETRLEGTDFIFTAVHRMNREKVDIRFHGVVNKETIGGDLTILGGPYEGKHKILLSR